MLIYLNILLLSFLFVDYNRSLLTDIIHKFK